MHPHHLRVDQPNLTASVTSAPKFRIQPVTSRLIIVSKTTAQVTSTSNEMTSQSTLYFVKL